jgi:hypothetical protein
MDWTEIDHNKAFEWIKSNIGKKVFIVAGSQKNYWYFSPQEVVIDRCSAEWGIEFSFRDGGKFVAQFDPTTLATSYRQDGINEAFSFELAGPDFFSVGVATDTELLRSGDGLVN